MKEIQLTKGKVALVDDADWEFLSQWKWRVSKTKHNFYAVRWGDWKKGETWVMHRIIMKTPKGMEVDHINNDGLDNQRVNLRNCTRAQNARNHPFSKRNTSGYKGVCWDKQKQKWMACTTWSPEGKKKNLFFGYFDDKREAAKAYDDGVKRLFGEYARPNSYSA